MSGMDHQATVDNRGLRMKIKRTKNMGPTSNKSDTKHEIVKPGEAKSAHGSSSSSSAPSSSVTDGISAANGSTVDKSKLSTAPDRDKSPKVKNLHKRERSKEKMSRDGNATSLSSVCSLDVPFSQVSLEPNQAEVPQGKKENLPDPYEFNAKVEDGIGFPVKKIKSEKNDSSTSSNSQSQSSTNASTETCSVGVSTDSEFLGPCEPGTSVTLEGIVWHETENGVLVVNVTWRDKTYVGTLLDATKHDWAPPRFNCDSPVSEFETRTPKGRAKRGRGSASTTPVNEKGPEGRKLRKGRKGSNTFQAPPSPAKSEPPTSGGMKRKGRPTDIDLSAGMTKRSRSCSQGNQGTESPVSTLIECPEPNCGKKYKHPNGLKYHQTHAHQSSGVTTDADEDTRDTCDNVDDDVDSSIADPSDTPDTNNAKLGKSESTEEESKKEEEGAKSDSENMEELEVDVNGETQKADSVEKKEPVVSCSASVNKNPGGKAITSIPSGNAFQIVSKQHIASPTFGGVGLLSQSPLQSGSIPSGQVLPLVTAVVTTNPVQTGATLTVAAISASTQPLDLKTESSKTEKPIRPKISHIMPQIVALTTSASVTHTNASPVTTANMQGTSQLIPIQPKPTPPGETTAPTPSFLGLNRDRKPKQKKRDKVKEKESPLAGPPISQSLAAAPMRTGKVEPLKNEQQSAGVIKVAPIIASKPLDHSKSESSTITSAPRLDRLDKPLSLSTSGTNVGVVTAQVQPSPKGVDLSQARPSDPPSMVKVNPSLAALESRSNRSEEVQSPSYYSDISEESGSPATHTQSESPQKNKDEGLTKNRDNASNVPNMPPSQPTVLDTQSVPPYMYGSYYGQPAAPYLLSPQNMSSPVGASSGPNTPTQQPPPPHPHHPSQPPHPHHPSQPHISLQTPNKDRSTPSEQSKTDSKLKREDSKDSDGKDDRGDKTDGRGMTQQEYHHMQHQKWVQQQMYALQIPPHAQYQFLATYGPYFDNAYHMHMMSNDPLYRQHHEQKLSEEEKNRADGERKEGDSSKPILRPPTSTDNGAGQSGDGLAGRGSLPPGEGHLGHKDGDLKRTGAESLSERELKERSMREKQNENHQIIKENLDLKDQMDRNRLDQRFDPMYGRDKTSEEQRRIQMYRQQAMIRHQKREEQHKKLGDGNKYEHRPSDSKSSVINQVGNSSGTDGRPRDHSVGASEASKSKMDIKREPEDKGYRDSSESDSKVSSGEKSKSLASSSSSSSFDRIRGHETPKGKPLSRVSSPHTPSSNSSSAVPSSMTAAGPSGPPYPAYMYPSQYMQSSMYGQMPFEPTHPMYRGMNPMMYGAYLHPSQIPPYPVNMEMDEKDKMGLVQKLAPTESEGKLSDPTHGPLYHSSSGPSASNSNSASGISKGNSGHKIHELQEKTRSVSSPHRASPVSVGKPDGPPTPTHSIGPLDKNREYSSSPPTQRHVHTHHHTHVVEAAYPVGYYPGMFPGASQQKSPPAATVQPQPGHPSYPPPK